MDQILCQKVKRPKHLPHVLHHVEFFLLFLIYQIKEYIKTSLFFIFQTIFLLFHTIFLLSITSHNQTYLGNIYIQILVSSGWRQGFWGVQLNFLNIKKCKYTHNFFILNPWIFFLTIINPKCLGTKKFEPLFLSLR